MANMADANSLEAVGKGLKAVRVLRNYVLDIFKSMSEGFDNQQLMQQSMAQQTLAQQQQQQQQAQQQQSQQGQQTQSQTQQQGSQQNQQSQQSQQNSSQQTSSGASTPHSSVPEVTPLATLLQSNDNAKGYVQDLQTACTLINNKLRELESACTLLGPSSGPTAVQLGQSSLLGQDFGHDKSVLYGEIVKTYRWFDKMVEFSRECQIRTNFQKRTLNPSFLHQRRTPLHRPRLAATGYNHNPGDVERQIMMLQRMFQGEMKIEFLRPFGSPMVVLVTLDRSLKCVLVLRGLIIENIVVKAFHEQFYTDEDSLTQGPGGNSFTQYPPPPAGQGLAPPGYIQNRTIDIWSESKYLVFRKITEQAYAMSLTSSQAALDLKLRQFFAWLKSYNNLFNKSCVKCGQRLKDFLPPTCRDFPYLNPYHEVCRP